MSAILYINDNNLRLSSAGAVHRSQGYAWLKNGDVHFDFDDTNNAVAACRLDPQQINSRYWQQCAQTALPNNASGMRHAADLIWRHLSELQNRHDLSKAAMVVPAHYQAENLQLLLGIANSLSLEVAALLNKAVLAVAVSNPESKSVLHVDVQLHQTVCSEVVRQGNTWQLGRVEVLHEVGLTAMQDALLKAAQERFIQADRFDPLHYAETEQQLFDQLPRLGSAIRTQGKVTLSVIQNGKQHSCSIDERQWMLALTPFVTALKSAQVDMHPELRCYDLNGFDVVDFFGGEFQSLAPLNISGAQIDQFSQTDANGRVMYLAEFPVVGAASGAALGVGQAAEKKVPADSTKNVEPKETTGNVTPASRSSMADTPVPDSGADGATHVLQHGVAIEMQYARFDFDGGSLSVARASESNLAEMLNSQQLFIVGDASRRELKPNDRLGSNFADGVVVVIRVA